MQVHHICDQIYLIEDILDLSRYPKLWTNIIKEANIDPKKGGRRMCRMTDPGMKYTLGGKSFAKKNYTETVKKIQLEVEEKLGIRSGYFNTCTMNFYPNGRSGFRHHTDYMKDLARPMIVTMLTLGDSMRPIELIPRENLTAKKKYGDRKGIAIELPHNSLLFMGPKMQNYWLHGIPKVKGLKEPRLSMSFRRQKLTPSEKEEPLEFSFI